MTSLIEGGQMMSGVGGAMMNQKPLMQDVKLAGIRPNNMPPTNNRPPSANSVPTQVTVDNN